MSSDTITRLRRIASLNRSRAIILDKLANILTVSPDVKKPAGARASAAVIKRRAAMFQELAEIESEIRRLDPMQLITTAYTPDGDSEEEPAVEPYDKPLRFLVWTILRESHLTMDELIHRIRRAGYQTKSLTNESFAACVQQAIGECRNAGLVNRDARTQLYKGVKTTDDHAWDLLNCKRLQHT